MTVQSDVTTIQAAIKHLRAWADAAPGDLDAIRSTIVSTTDGSVRPGDEIPKGNWKPGRSQEQRDFIADFTAIRAAAETTGSALKTMCTTLEKYTENFAWVEAFTTDEQSWRDVAAPLEQGVAATELNTKLKAYTTWEGKDAAAYRSTAIDHHYAMLTAASAARALQTACQKIEAAGKDFYKALRQATVALDQYPPDVPKTYSAQTPPTLGQAKNWKTTVIGDDSNSASVAQAVTAFEDATRSVFIVEGPQDVPNRPGPRVPLDHSLSDGWPKRGAKF